MELNHTQHEPNLPPPMNVVDEIKKAGRFLIDNTYTPDDFVSHIQSIIDSVTHDGARHKHQLESMIFRYQELRHEQSLFFAGHRDRKSTCIKLERALDAKSKNLLSMGYSIERFQQQPPTQKTIF